MFFFRKYDFKMFVFCFCNNKNKFLNFIEMLLNFVVGLVYLNPSLQLILVVPGEFKITKFFCPIHEPRHIQRQINIE